MKMKNNPSYTKGLGVLILFLIGMANACLQPTTPTPASSSETDTVEVEKITLNEDVGRQIVEEAFDTLSRALMHLLQTEGAVEAIRFCNIHALPITSLAENHGITISRQATRYRNPNNAADKETQALLLKMKEWQNGDWSKKHVLVENEKEIRYYQPIITMPQCLVCHGSPGDQIPLDVIDALNEKYPQDNATDFLPLSLRGVWVLVQPKS
jgi:hypothetical protein